MPGLIMIALLQQHETDALTELVRNRAGAPESYGSSKSRRPADRNGARSLCRTGEEEDARIEVGSKEGCSMSRRQKITFADMRDMGVRGLLIYCSDYKCSHLVTMSGDGWPDDIRLSDLEFKTLSDCSGDRLTKDDRRVIARAVCGMANAEGGTIVIGVETKRVDNVDVAVGAKPIHNANKFRNLVKSPIPEMLSPQHSKIEVHSIIEDGFGFLKIEVPASDSRPYYSNVHHQYFRRGSDGTRVLEHGEVRELMLAIREASLEIDWGVCPDMSVGDLRFSLFITLALRNTSRVPVIAPHPT
jgi:Putative DNA-binding domain